MVSIDIVSAISDLTAGEAPAKPWRVRLSGRAGSQCGYGEPRPFTAYATNFRAPVENGGGLRDCRRQTA